MCPRTLLALALAAFAIACSDTRDVATDPDGGANAGSTDASDTAGFDVDWSEVPQPVDGRELDLGWGNGVAGRWCYCLERQDGISRQTRECYPLVEEVGFPIYDTVCIAERVWTVTPEQQATIECVEAELDGDYNSVRNTGFCGTEDLPEWPATPEGCFDCLESFIQRATDRCGIIEGTEIAEIFALCRMDL